MHQPGSMRMAVGEWMRRTVGIRRPWRRRLNPGSVLYAVLAIVASVLPAAANDLGAFDAGVAAADRHYREAAFYLRTGNVGAGAIELEMAIAGWEKVRQEFRNRPPDVYADDAQWTVDLDAIAASLKAGLADADRGDGPAAAATLAAVRTTLGAMRRRNGQWRFSDCVDAMNAEMEKLWRYRQEPPDLGSVEAVDQAKAQAAVTLHWYRRCRAEAPSHLRDDTEFNRLFDGSIASLSLIPSELNEANEIRFINILREMRSFDRMIWLRFG